jgi:hypothetical protein
LQTEIIWFLLVLFVFLLFLSLALLLWPRIHVHQIFWSCVTCCIKFHDIYILIAYEYLLTMQTSNFFVIFFLFVCWFKHLMTTFFLLHWIATLLFILYVYPFWGLLTSVVLLYLYMGSIFSPDKCLHIVSPLYSLIYYKEFGQKQSVKNKNKIQADCGI